MNNNSSDYLDKFISYYNPIRNRIGNIGVLAAGLGLIVMSFFIRTDIFGLLLDLLGALGVLSGIFVFIIGFVMLGIEKGWWNGPAALGGETSSRPPIHGAGANYDVEPPAAPPTWPPAAPSLPPPAAPPTQPAAPLAQPATPVAPTPVPPVAPAEPPAPSYQPPGVAPPPVEPYRVPYQEPYGVPYPQRPAQGGLPLPGFVARNQGKILFAILAMFLGSMVWGGSWV